MRRLSHLGAVPAPNSTHLSGHRTAAPIVLVATRCIAKGGAGAPHQWPPGAGRSASGSRRHDVVQDLAAGIGSGTLLCRGRLSLSPPGAIRHWQG
ncbi:hypothetical protein Q4I28_000987 [Leishmania naiffi]|uniref:Uncharacterized protein n=1 Tax=Leishmania naiffi TaxID=5678 RepID=A0AAW3C988_9TRYP